MRKFVVFLAAGALLSLAALSSVAQNHAARNGSGQLVIVFKDGHRQTFNFADVARIEFSGNGGIPVGDSTSAPRGRSSPRTFSGQVGGGGRERGHFLHHSG